MVFPRRHIFHRPRKVLLVVLARLSLAVRLRVGYERALAATKAAETDGVSALSASQVREEVYDVVNPSIFASSADNCYVAIAEGNCASLAATPIGDSEVCAAAAAELGQAGQISEAPDAIGVPEGCYLKPGNLPGHRLWLATHPSNAGQGAVHGRYPVCAREQGHRSVVLSNFWLAGANGVYNERVGPRWTVEVWETYWSPDGRLVLFACGSPFPRWSLGGAHYFEELRRGACAGAAVAPIGVELLDTSLPRGWHEWNGAAWEFNSQAGVSYVGEACSSTDSITDLVTTTETATHVETSATTTTSTTSSTSAITTSAATVGTIEPTTTSMSTTTPQPVSVTTTTPMPGTTTWSGSASRHRAMVLESLVVENRCQLPVFFFEGGPRRDPMRIRPGATVSFTGDPDEPELRMMWPRAGGTGRVTFGYTRSSVSGSTAVVELGDGFPALGVPGRHWNFNLINQHGFIDLNLEMALWRDSIGGELACEDARIQTQFNSSDCEAFPDASARRVLRHSEDGEVFGACEAAFETLDGDYNPEACTSHYASYVNDRSKLFLRSTNSWNPSARSVGYSSRGFERAIFADGATMPASGNGRQDHGRAINFECFEAPCMRRGRPNSTCMERGHVSVGNSGFNIRCFDNTRLETIGAMQIILCPEAGR